MRIVRLFATAALAVALVGCTSNGSEPKPSPSGAVTTPVAEPAPSQGTIVELALGGSELTAFDADGVELSVSLNDGDAVVELLESILGPADVRPPSEECSVQFALWVDGAVGAATLPGNPELLILNFDVASAGGVALRSTTDVAVGDDVTDVLAALPDDRIGPDGLAYLYEISGADSDGHPVGGVAFVDPIGDRSVVYSLISPFQPVATGFC